MWVFDGEQWVDEGRSQTDARTTERPRPTWDESMPELQVIEVEYVPPVRPLNVPLLPLP